MKIDKEDLLFGTIVGGFKEESSFSIKSSDSILIIADFKRKYKKQ